MRRVASRLKVTPYQCLESSATIHVFRDSRIGTLRRLIRNVRGETCEGGITKPSP